MNHPGLVVDTNSRVATAYRATPATITGLRPMESLSRPRGAENTNVPESIQKTTSIDCDEASSPASAKPTAVDPNWAIAMIEFAAPSSSSGAISGRTESLAGEKNWVIDAETITATYSQATWTWTRNGIVRTTAARSRSAVIMIRLRS